MNVLLVLVGFSKIQCMDQKGPLNPQENHWKKCSSCKKPLGFNVKYYTCSVSTCNGQRTGYVFCSVPCFEVHLPSARHKSAAAIEMRSPAATSASQLASSSSQGQRRIISQPPQTFTSPSAMNPQSSEVLVIASRLKDYIQKSSDMNTSADVMQVLSNHLRGLCDRAIGEARSSGRKTVMARDFDFLKRK